jgi:hypothetical protein
MKTSKFAPIIVFAFNRPRHLKKTLDALAACPESQSSDLRIYCDAARKDSEAEQVAAVRSLAKSESRFASCTVIEATINMGLARSIIAGVTATVEQFGRVIVLEDDIVVTPNFLKFMNSGLDFYDSKPEVASVCAYMYPINPDGLPPTFFLKGTDCWGWATWKRAWDIFEPDGIKLLNQINSRNLRWAFDLDGSYPYCKMLQDQIAGKNNSWAIRWHASAYLKGMMSCFPNKSLVQNIGLDGSGTHCEPTDKYGEVTDHRENSSLEFRPEINEHLLGRSRVAKFLLSLRPFRSKIIRRIQRLLQYA